MSDIRPFVVSCRNVKITPAFLMTIIGSCLLWISSLVHSAQYFLLGLAVSPREHIAWGPQSKAFTSGLPELLPLPGTTYWPKTIHFQSYCGYQLKKLFHLSNSPHCNQLWIHAAESAVLSLFASISVSSHPCCFLCGKINIVTISGQGSFFPTFVKHEALCWHCTNNKEEIPKLAYPKKQKRSKQQIQVFQAQSQTPKRGENKIKHCLCPNK